MIFGHHDYFYDNNTFPIPDYALNSEEYRLVMKNILSEAKKHNIEYIDGIHPLLNDPIELQRSLQYLKSAGHSLIGKLSVHKNQIPWIVDFIKIGEKVFTSDEYKNMSENEKIILAKEIINNYEHRDNNLGVLKTKEAKYISPQMYMAAKKYIETK